jgi:hypothetical protein
VAVNATNQKEETQRRNTILKKEDKHKENKIIKEDLEK